MEGLVKGLPVGRDTCSAVFQRRRCVVSWCSALTISHSSNIHNKFTEVGGVFSVVIHRYKCLFCKLGSSLSKFHKEINVFFVAVIWTNGRMEFSAKDYYFACIFY